MRARSERAVPIGLSIAPSCGSLWAVAQFRHLRVLLFSVVGMAGCCTAGCGEDVFSSLHVLRVTPTLEVSEHASQCSSLDVSSSEGSSVSGVAAPNNGRPDFWFEERSDNQGIAFTFGSGSATREEKLYRNLFYETHKLDRFVVESLMGDHYVVTVWGDTACDTCAPGSKTTVVGDEQVCGAEEALQLVDEMTDSD